MSWRNLKIGKKLYIGFGLVLILAVAIGYTGYNGLTSVGRTVELADDANRLVKYAKDTAIQRNNFAATKNKDNLKTIEEICEKINNQIDETKARFRDAADIALIEEAKGSTAEYLDGWYRMIQNQEDIEAAIEKMDASAAMAVREVDALRESQKEQMNKEFADKIEHGKLNERVGKADDANRLVKGMLGARIHYRDFRRTEKEEYAVALNKVVDELIEQCKKTRMKMKRQANIDQMNAIQNGVETYRENFNAIVDLKNEARKLDEEMAKLGAEIVAVADELREGQKNKMNSAQTSAITMAVSFVIGALIIGIFVAFIIARGIVNPINKMMEAINKLAQGDLTHKSDIDQKDEIGLMASELNNTIDQLHDSMITVSNNTDQLVSAATEISSASEELSAGIKEQTNQTAQVSTAVEEMTATIVESTKNVADASDKSKNAAEKSQEGSSMADEASRGMDEIVESSNETAKNIEELSEKATAVGEIISVIDDIADQTNLLALNAAIEAARAGEQGRGFAVVADEVRKLAERTTKATKEVADNIKGIQADVNCH